VDVDVYERDAIRSEGLPERRAVDDIAAGVTAPAQVTVLARADMSGDEAVESQQMAASALLWWQHHPPAVGVENQIANLAAHTDLYIAFA
jgi:hypothetical protein